MRRFLGTALVVLLLSAAPAALAQERVLNYSTSVDPDFYVFDQTAFQRDANGERVRDEEGRFKLERQFVTLNVEASMECAVPPDGEQISFFLDGPRAHLRNASSQEIISTYLDLEPREFNLTWEQNELAGEWFVATQIQVEILSNAKPANTIEGNFTWFVDQVDIPEACPQEAWDSDVQNHFVIIPGFDFDPSDFEEIPDTPDGGRGIPAPGAVGLMAALGMAVALRRRH